MSYNTNGKQEAHSDVIAFLSIGENVSEHETQAVTMKLNTFPVSDEGTSAAISQGEYVLCIHIQTAFQQYMLVSLHSFLLQPQTWTYSI